MRLEEIVKIIDNKDVKFSYYAKKNMLNRNYLVYIDVLNMKQRAEYREKSEIDKKKYVSSSARIMLPDVTDETLTQIYKKGDPITFDFTMKKVRKIISIQKINESMAFSTYLILHEIGHWYHFDEMGRKPYIYAHEDSKLRQEVFRKQNNLALEMSIKKYNGKLTEEDVMKMRNSVIEYINIPMEKRANTYANNHFKIIWQKLNVTK